MELAEDVADVRFDGFLADDQFLGDCGIGEALGDQAQDFELAVAQIQEAVPGRGLLQRLYDPGRDAGMQDRFAARLCGRLRPASPRSRPSGDRTARRRGWRAGYARRHDMTSG
jgi:hypothetical protein